MHDVEGVVTIGAPSSPEHVLHQFSDHLDEIQDKGHAEVLLGGRPFTIKDHFVEDVKKYDLNHYIHDFGKALCLFHSPQDDTVSIDNAKAIYTAARHPKSFVSLDGASHLLIKSPDADYVGEVVSSWSRRYICKKS